MLYVGADDLSDPTPIAVLLKDKDKKCHREGHLSCGHLSKKLKDSVIFKAFVVASVGQDGPSSMARDVSSAGGSVDSLKTGLHRCKAYAEKVAIDFGKLLSLGEVADAAEVTKLREEIQSLRAENLDLEKKSDALTKDNNASADRVYSLLTEKFELKVNVRAADKSKLIIKLDGMAAQLARCKTEALGSFEEGYGECVKRLAEAGLEVSGHNFQC
ncbi:hypothetical protein AgCh_021177 [Apium graveolens]